MKIILPLYFLGLVMLSISCRQNVPTFINGNLTNISDTSITIEIGKDPITGLEPSEYPKVHKLSKDGTFSIPIETSFPVQAVLYSENFVFFSRVLLLHSGEITLNADCSDIPNTLKYSGAGASLNAFYYDLEKYEAVVSKELSKNAGTISLYEKSLDSIQAIMLTMLNDFQNEEPLSNDELLWLSSKIKYGKYYDLMNRAFQLDLEITDSGSQIFQTLNLEDHNASMISRTYNELILRYILHEVNSMGLNYSDYSDNSEYFRGFFEIINEKLDGKVRDVALTILISDMLKNYNDLAEQYYRYYLVECKSADMVEKTTDLYQKYSNIVNQPLSENVNIIATNQQKPFEVLTQFRNKVILMDFWASWCSPCIKGFPLTRKLAEDYENQSVEVLYIGNNDQKSSLINAIKEYQLYGDHIILNEEESDIWRGEFEIRGIPTYILIDQEGKIVKMDNPHKITDETYLLIDSLLLAL